MSAVCAYTVSSIGDVFNEGKFKTSVAVETSHVKWVMYTGEVPVPRPGAVRSKRSSESFINTHKAILKSKLYFVSSASTTWRVNWG